MYQIIKVNRYYRYGAQVTAERTLKVNAPLEEVLALVKKQKADAEEVLEELKEYGITAFKGYMISEM